MSLIFRVLGLRLESAKETESAAETADGYTERNEC